MSKIAVTIDAEVEVVEVVAQGAVTKVITHGAMKAEISGDTVKVSLQGYDKFDFEIVGDGWVEEHRIWRKWPFAKIITPDYPLVVRANEPTTLVISISAAAFDSLGCEATADPSLQVSVTSVGMQSVTICVTASEAGEAKIRFATSGHSAISYQSLPILVLPAIKGLPLLPPPYNTYHQVGSYD